MIMYYDGETVLAKVDIMKVANRYRALLPGVKMMYVAQILAQDLADLLRVPVQYGWAGCKPRWEEWP